MATQVQFNYQSNRRSFTLWFPMEAVPRVGDYIFIEHDGEFKVRKVVWRQDSDHIGDVHIELRKPFSSEF